MMAFFDRVRLIDKNLWKLKRKSTNRFVILKEQIELEHKQLVAFYTYMQKDKDKNKKKQAAQFLECIEKKVARYFAPVDDEERNEKKDQGDKSVRKSKGEKEEEVDELMPLLKKYAKKL